MTDAEILFSIVQPEWEGKDQDGERFPLLQAYDGDAAAIEGSTVQPGDRLGSFEVLSLIGAGGMGEVYEARDLRLGRRVAIKVLNKTLSSDRKASSAFEREARAIASLSHPNILAIHEFGHEGEVVYAVTELLEGETLRQLIATRRFSWRKATQIALAICDGLIAAHAKGVVHRDLKPENVFVTADGVVKILDFGLAAAPRTRPTDSGVPTVTAPITAGTIGYMAPEQLRAEETDARADLFALGCILYEMLAGAAPFSRPTRVETITAALRDDPEALRARAGDAPLSLITAVERCLEKRKEDRFQSTRDLRFALASSIAEADRTIPVLRGQRKVVVAVAAAVLVILATAVVIGRGGGGPPKDPHIRRIAILPFDDLSRTNESGYFGEGMTDAVIANLAQIGSLDVISRTTAMQYANTDKSIPDIAKELGVDAVIEGAVLRSGGRIRVTAQLIDPATDRQIWSRTYEREAGDVLQLQAELAGDIASEINARVTPEERKRLAGSRVEPEVYEVYLKGEAARLNWNFERAATFYQQAIEMDPAFAPAHARLASIYAFTYVTGEKLLEGQQEVARAAAERAIFLDPTAPEGHLASALVKTAFDWDLDGARRSVERGLSLAPGNADAHSLYAEYWLTAGSPRRALAEFRRALELDPQNGNAWLKVAETCYALGDFECAETHARRALALPGHFFHRDAARGVIAAALAHLGDLNQAVALVSQSAESGSRDFRYFRIYRIAGDAQKAAHYMERLQVSDDPVRRIHAAALAGDVDTVIGYLEPLVARRQALAFGVFNLANDPDAGLLRADPRFRALVEQVRAPRPAGSVGPESKKP